MRRRRASWRSRSTNYRCAVAMLVELHNATALAADRAVLSGISLTVNSGDRLGVVGINGTGKSTLLSILAGTRALDDGVLRRGRSVTLHALDQHPNLGNGTIRDVVGSGWRVEAALDRLGIAHLIDAPVATLSGGQTKRVALATAAAQEVDLLILDEPTNHLDLAGVLWLEEWLTTTAAAVVLVSHDRYLLDRLTTKMVELDRGAAFTHHGGYGSYLEAVATREEHAASAEVTRKNLARRELAWLRRGAKARTRKPQARIAAAHALLDGGPQAAARTGDLALETQMARLGNQVFELHDIAVAFDGAPPILSEVNLLIGPGDRLAVVGANGAGKSTLLDVLARGRQPTSGRLITGPTVVVGYYDQHASDLDPNATVREVVAGPFRPPGSPEDLALMQRFWFTGSLPFTEVRELSGGERRRLQLLAVLAQGPNVLLLDEPTNDLDLETLRVLESFLDEWPGTLIVVSHDRAFLEQMTDTVLHITPTGSVAEVPGGLEAWVQGLRVPSTRRAPTARADDGDPAPASAIPLGRRLRDAEKEMTRLQRQCDKLSDQLLTVTDHQVAATLGAELRSLREALHAAEEAWLLLAAGD